MSTQNPALARLRAAQGRVMECPRCHSRHFHTIQVNRYLSGGYGTVSIQPDPEGVPADIQVCICGMPIVPGTDVVRKAGGAAHVANKELRESVDACQAYLKSQDPKAVTDQLLTVAAGKSVEGAVETLKVRVNHLEKSSDASTSTK